jgi:hypothetical protein
VPANDPIIDGDTHFVGVNMRLDPGQLKPGFCASAKNKRFVNGKASTRPGIKKMPWSNKAADAWSNDPEGDPLAVKSYNAGSIVTYSGVSAEVEGTGATAAAVEDGTGILYLKDANRLNLQSGDFTASTGWVFTGATTVSTAIMLLVDDAPTVFAAASVEALTVAMSTSDTITFEGGGVLTLSAPAIAGATSVAGTLTVATVQQHEEGAITSGWVYDATLDCAKITGGSGTLNLYQDIGTLKGCAYVVTYTVNDWTAGSIQPFLSGSYYGVKRVHGGGTVNDTTYTDTIIPKGINSQRLYLQATSGFLGQITNVTVTPVSLPDQVDVLGTFEQWSTNWRAAGPANNISAGPFFKAKITAQGQPPLTSYTAISGVTAASSVVNGTYWEDKGHRTYGYGTVYGTGIFRDPASTEYVLVAASDGVYATKEGNPSTKLAGVSSISSDVDFVQCFNTVVMFQGDDVEPVAMTRIDIGFVAISQTDTDITIDENDDDGTETIPNASTGLFFANRLLIPHSKDLVAASDFLNYTRYSPVMSNFRINQGSEDELVSLVRINNSTIACFKTNSIYIVSNIYGNMADITLDEVTREYGAVGKNSIVQVGDDVVFLSSKKGVTSLGVAQHGKVSAVDVPMSEPIQPLIDRINWNAASGAAAAYHNNRLYMAVPLDGSSDNNVILIFDYLAGGWAGYDTLTYSSGRAIKVKQFLETTHQGKRRLFFLDTDGFINLYDDALTECGFVDELPKSTDSAHADFGNIEIEQISDEIVTRGYTAGDISSKKWQSAEVQLATNDPSFTVNAQFDGPEEDNLELVGNQTFSRTQYDRPFDKADYVESMAGDDFMTKFRQDYSVNLDTEIDLPDGVGADDNVGFDPDLHQQSQNRYRYRGEGRYVQLKVANTNGRAELVATKVGAIPGQNLTNKAI